MAVNIACRLGPNDDVLLRGVADENVTWRMDGGGRITFKLWETETEGFIVTRRMKVLEAAGYVKRSTVWRYNAGFVELTPEGKVAI